MPVGWVNLPDGWKGRRDGSRCLRRFTEGNGRIGSQPCLSAPFGLNLIATDVTWNPALAIYMYRALPILAAAGILIDGVTEAQRVRIERLSSEEIWHAKARLQFSIQPPYLHVNIGTDIRAVDLRFQPAQLTELDLLQDDLGCSFKSVISSIEQEGCHDDNDRRADHKKYSAHKSGIQQGQTKPKRHVISDVG